MSAGGFSLLQQEVVIPIIRQHRVYRTDLRANPTVLYIFGDNQMRVGLGGQAAEMRGEPNAVGVCTKKTPGRNALDFWTDHDYDANMRQFNHDMVTIIRHLRKGGLVVFPNDGIGTGLSELPTRAPITHWEIEQAFKDLFDAYSAPAGGTLRAYDHVNEIEC